MTLKFAAGLIAGIAATAAVAQVPPGTAPGQRGGHTRAEVAQRVQAMFDRLDGDRDGAISRAELERVGGQRGQSTARGRGMGGMAGRLFGLADGNGDGRVTRAEATGAALRHFDAADRNRDGVLTPAERQAARGQWGAGGRR